MPVHFLRCAALVLALALANATLRAADNWPQFRGPQGNGISDAKTLPLTWSETNHVVWKTAIHGRSWSSPVVWGNQVWVTTANDDGTELFAVCIARDTGKITHDLKLFTLTKQTDIRKFNTYASPTPVQIGRAHV